MLEIIERLDEAINPDYGKTPYDLYRMHHPNVNEKWSRNFILEEAYEEAMRESKNRQ